MMSFKEYKVWLDSGFLSRNGGWIPQHLESWCKSVSANHQNLYTLIDGDIVSKSYNLESLQKPIDINQDPARSIISRIIYLLPNLLLDNKIEKSAFSLPVAALGNHNAIKLSRVITRYARDYGYGNDVCVEVDKLVSQLGEIWAKSRTTSCDLNITLSITPKAFTLLGHYGPDNNSCFRQGSSSPYDKYILGQSKETFVVTVSKFDEKKKKDKNVARAIGWFDRGNFYIRNYYFAEGFQEGDFLNVCEKLFSDLLRSKVKISDSLGLFTNTSYNNWRFYENNYGNWCFYTNIVTASTLSLNIDNIVIFICPVCNNAYKNKNYWTKIDEETACPKCAENANMCEISGIRTFKPLFPLIDENSNIVEVHESILKDYKKCNRCNKHTCTTMETDIGDVCPECFAVDFSYCECKHHHVLDENIIDIGDISVCKDHLDEFMDSDEYNYIINEHAKQMEI